MRRMKVPAAMILLIAAYAFALIPLYARELDTAKIQVGGTDLIVELAADRASWERGLMYREELPEGRGMLFIYPKAAKVRLWMHNTYIPLSAAFIKEGGAIAQIIRMEKTDSSRIYESEEKVKYALEVPLGWFKKNGITAGERCRIELDR